MGLLKVIWFLLTNFVPVVVLWRSDARCLCNVSEGFRHPNYIIISPLQAEFDTTHWLRQTLWVLSHEAGHAWLSLNHSEPRARYDELLAWEVGEGFGWVDKEDPAYKAHKAYCLVGYYCLLSNKGVHFPLTKDRLDQEVWAPKKLAAKDPFDCF